MSLVTKHHISIYDNVDEHAVVCGEYHYTATIQVDVPVTQLLTLHVYFDGKNQATRAPQLSCVSNNDVERVNVKLSAEFADELLQLGFDETSQVVASLRKKISEYIAAQKSLYDELNAELTELSRDLVANQEKYLLVLARVRVVVEVLAVVDDGVFYSSVRRIYGDIERSLLGRKKNLKSLGPAVKPQDDKLVPQEDKLVPQNDKLVPQDDKPEQQDDDTKSNSTSRVVSSTATIAKSIHKTVARKSVPKLRNSKNPFLEALKAATQTMNAFKELDTNALYKTKVKAHLDVTAKLSNVMTAYCGKNMDEIGVDELQAFRDIRAEARSKGEVLLGELLMAGEFVLAKQLNVDCGDIAEKLVTMAIVLNPIDEKIKKRNVDMLTFVLNNTDFPINTFLIGGLTLVGYCFEKHKGNASKADLLSILVKSGASLMGLKLGDDLPYAHYIVNPDHPLNGVLMENKEKTIGSKHFYLRLVRCLNRALANTDLTAERREKLTNIKNAYVLEMQLIEMRVFSPLNVNFSVPDSFLGPVMSRRLLEDPDIVAASRVMNKAMIDYVKQVPLNERRTLMDSEGMRESESFYRNTSMNCPDKYFAELKKSNILQVQWLTIFYNTSAELVMVEAELKDWKAKLRSGARVAKDVNRVASRKAQLDVVIDNVLDRIVDAEKKVPNDESTIYIRKKHEVKALFPKSEHATIENLLANNYVVDEIIVITFYRDVSDNLITLFWSEKEVKSLMDNLTSKGEVEGSYIELLRKALKCNASELAALSQQAFDAAQVNPTTLRRANV